MFSYTHRDTFDLFQAGEIVHFLSLTAGKPKWHLCVQTSCFLFLNSPKHQIYAGELVVDCAALPGVPPTPSGKSVISCTPIVRMSDRQLNTCEAKLVGRIDAFTIATLLDYVRNSRDVKGWDRSTILSGFSGTAMK